ncbi:MAG: ABC transporter permease, partial [Methanobrevibacter sp.]|nr:ABC transporter permease [Methanobrevibacter sp.]
MDFQPLGGSIIRFITLILKNPFRNKTRSALSIIGIAIGIATIVALGLITAGMEDSVQSTFNEGSAEITVSNSTVIGTNTGTLQPSLVDELKNITNVSDTAGQLSVTEANYSSMQSRGSSMMMTVYGIEPSKLKLIGIDEVNGSVYEENSSQAIVGIFYSERNNISIGDNITVRGEEFEVVGIFE